MTKVISIKGARANNLQNIDIDIPRHKLIVITGLSGSGKSSLAFDTIYAEGQRRYLESLSSYAKQYIDLMDKSDVDQITGLTPAIAIDQKNNTNNPRSTIGTATEIYDLLRLLFSRIGQPHCPTTNKPMTKQSVEDIVAKIVVKQQVATILSPLARNEKIEDPKIIKHIIQAGFNHVRYDGKIYNLAEEEIFIDDGKHTLEIIIAHDKFDNSNKFELQKYVKKTLDLSNGLIDVVWEDKNKTTEDSYSTVWTCLESGFTLEDLEPKHFSFNSPQGACSDCHGLGIKLNIDPELLFNKKLSINEGAVRAWPKNNGQYAKHLKELEGIAKKNKFSLATPVKDLTKKQCDLILLGNKDFIGIIKLLEQRYVETESISIKQDIEQYMKTMKCPQCQGNRLKPEYLAVTVSGFNIAELNALTIEQAEKKLNELKQKLDQSDKKIAEPIIEEICSRLNALNDAGLDYISLDRPMNTLSGGEAQRVKLATQLSSNLVNVTYVLDEPSVGLHGRDMNKLIDTLKKLRDLENTVIVVEHDQVMMDAADYIIDVGPGAGSFGGQIVAQGTPKEIHKNSASLTGHYLSGKKQIIAPKNYRKGSGKKLIINGAREHNLKNINVVFPLGIFTAVTGVSGSGKSTLMTDILARALNKKFYRAKCEPGAHKEIKGMENIDKVIFIDQSPIGRTPRSNPATYTGAFSYIRDLFAQLPEARIKNLNAGHFSFNVVGGRCEVCGGDGLVKIDMQFLSDVYVKCKSCQGKRYQRDILDIYYTPKFSGYEAKNIADVLEMPVVEAKDFFRDQENIIQKLNILDEVGLGYVKLGQSATTLSGGEAQRVKLATELSRRETSKTLYILDEPTTGLHFDDIKRLLTIIHKLVDKGNTVLIIEHNLDVIKSVDHIIDLGPEGGDKGGEIVAQGTPKEVAKCKKSYTGQYLKKVL